MGYYVKVSNRFSESFPTVIFRMWFLFCNKMIKSDIYYFYEGTWEGCKKYAESGKRNAGVRQILALVSSFQLLLLCISIITN